MILVARVERLGARLPGSQWHVISTSFPEGPCGAKLRVCGQAKADGRERGREEERLRRAVELRDARLATLVADKQRLAEEAEQRQREVRASSAEVAWRGASEDILPAHSGVVQSASKQCRAANSALTFQPPARCGSFPVPERANNT